MTELNEPSSFPLHTKRQVIGQVLMCRGCCCGDVERGKPEVPVDWLKQEWRQRGLVKDFDLSFSGCLGPCDLTNVVSISDATGSVWLGQIEHKAQYLGLLDWATQSKAAGRLLPLPTELEGCRFNRFRTMVSGPGEEPS